MDSLALFTRLPAQLTLISISTEFVLRRARPAHELIGHPRARLPGRFVDTRLTSLQTSMDWLPTQLRFCGFFSSLRLWQTSTTLGCEVSRSQLLCFCRYDPSDEAVTEAQRMCSATKLQLQCPSMQARRRLGFTNCTCRFHATHTDDLASEGSMAPVSHLFPGAVPMDVS